MEKLEKVNKKVERLEARVNPIVKTKLKELSRITGNSQSKIMADLIENEYQRVIESE